MPLEHVDKSELLAGTYRKKSEKLQYCLSQGKSNNYLELFIFLEKPEL